MTKSIALLFAVGFLACTSGPDSPEPECQPWRFWQDVDGMQFFKYRMQYCGYDEAKREQIWRAQFRNERHSGISFKYHLGEEPREYRMDLPAVRTRTTPKLRVVAADPSQMVWIIFGEYCTWAPEERSCKLEP